jgi:tetratricopeptide (TPR) repeat protein
MALANVAVLLTQYGYKTLVVDWDLEAPGLEFFFKNYFSEVDLPKIAQQEGVVDLLNQVFEGNLAPEEAANLDELLVEMTLPSSKRPLYFLTAGRRDADYFPKVRDLDLEIFYAEKNGAEFIEALRTGWKNKFDYILVDSRTGITDNGQICTTQLPDMLVLVLTATEQGLNGTLEVVRKTVTARQTLSRPRPNFVTLPILSRFDSREEFASSKQWLERTATELAEIYNGWLPSMVSRRDFLEVTKIPYQAYFSFGERLPVLEQGTLDPTGLGYAYETLAALIANRLTAVEQLLKNRREFVESVKASLETTITTHLAARDWEAVIDLLDDETLRSFYHAGRAKMLNDWLSKFPFAYLEQHPRLLLWWGQILNDNFGQAKRAIAFFSLAEEEFGKRKLPIKVAEAQIWQSVGLRMMGRATEAVELAEKGLTRLKTLAADDPRLVAWATRNRGLAYGTAGNIEQALFDTRDALRQFEALNQKYLVGLCHHDIGVSLERQANFREAEQHYRKAVTIWKALGNDNDLTNSLIGLGRILSEVGHHEEALTMFNESLEIALRVGTIRRAAFAMAGIGDAHFRRKAYEEAIKAYKLSTGYAQDAQVQLLEVTNQIQISECLYYLNQPGNLSEALAQAKQGRITAAENGLSFEEGLACIVQAKIHIRLEQYKEGFKLLEEAVAYFTEHNAVESMIARLRWAYAAHLARDNASALTQLEAAFKFTSVIESTPIPQGLMDTIAEVRPMLDYFVAQPDTPQAVKSGLALLAEMG